MNYRTWIENMHVDVKCSVCGKLLNAKWYTYRLILNVDPCKTCLEKERRKWHDKETKQIEGDNDNT